MSTMTQVAEAVKVMVNAGAYSLPFTAERHYRPVHDLTQLQALTVSVVPQGMTIVTAGRASNQHDYRIDVAVQQKFDDDGPAALDPLMAVVEEIADHMRFKRLASLPEAIWVKTENVPIYAPEHLEQHRVFTSVLTLTYRIVK